MSSNCSYQGTLAKSGTSDFLARAEGQDTAGTGNLIGAFGLGFYSSFLVADRVHVASIPPKTKTSPTPVQYVFSSSAEDTTFEVYPDPRGNTLGRGTEITLHLKEDATEYLDDSRIISLMYGFSRSTLHYYPLTCHGGSNKHSSYSSSFPIYLFTQSTKEIPDEDITDPSTSDSMTSEATEPTEASVLPEKLETDEDQATIEEVPSDEEKTADEPVLPKMKSVVVDEWTQLNAQPPLWTRFVLHRNQLSCFIAYEIFSDPKNITDGGLRLSLRTFNLLTRPTEEYSLFYSAFFKDFSKPLAWHHFSGDSGSGVSFKAILYLPAKL